MANNASKSTIRGRVIGYIKGLGLILNKSLVLVKVEKKIICIPVDYRQEKFIEKEFPPGACMALDVHNGRWQIGSKPAQGIDVIMRMDRDCVVNYHYV